MLIRSGPRAVSGNDIPFLKPDGIQLFNRTIPNGMAEVSANYHIYGEIMRGSDALLISGCWGQWEEVGDKTGKLLLVLEL